MRIRLFLLVFAVAMGVYLVSIPSHPSIDPGLSYVNAASGAGEYPPTSHPVWSALIAAISRVVPHAALSPALRIACFLLAACAAGLLALLVLAVPRNRIPGEASVVDRAAEHGLSERWIRFLSAALGGLALAFSPPGFGVASTLGPGALDLALLLAVCVLLLVFFRETIRPVPALSTAAFLAGIGISESVTFALLAPFFILLGISGLTRRGRIRWKRAAPPAFFAVLGVLCGFAVIPLFWMRALRNDAFPGRTVGSLLLDQLRLHWMTLRMLLSPIGVILTLVAVIIPVGYVFLTAKGHETGRRMGWFVLLLLLFLTAVSGAVVFETVISPAALYTGAMVVLPTAASAALLGYLGGVWIATAWGAFPRRRRIIRRSLRTAVLVLLLLAPAALAVLGWKARAAYRRTGIAEIARRAARQLEEGGVVVFQGDMLDELVRYYAAPLRHRPIWIDLSRPGLPDRQRYYRGLFPEFRERDRRIEAEEIALSAARLRPEGFRTFRASLLHRLGVPYRASGFWFVQRSAEAGAPPAVDDLSELARQSASFSARPLDPWFRIELLCSRMLNDAAVAYELEGKSEEAAVLFRKAVEACPDNVSALMNLAQVQFRNGDEEAIRTVESTRRIFEEGKAVRDLDWLALYHGIIHSPDAYARMGISLASRGQENSAIAEIEKALELAPDAVRLQTLLARLQIRRGDLAEAEKRLVQILRKDPEDRQAKEAYALLKARQGDAKTAVRMLDEIVSGGAAPPEIVGAVALLRAHQGDLAGARKLIEGLPASQRNQPRLLVIRAYLAAMEGREYQAEDLLREAQGAISDSPELQLLSASVYRRLGLDSKAEKTIRSVLERDPDNMEALSQLVLGIMRGGHRTEEAEEPATRMLKIEPDNWLANLAMGTVELERDRPGKAVEFFRKSVQSRETALALNNLAWALDRAGRPEEAVEYARRGLEMAPDYVDLLDTLGWIEFRLGHLEEAKRLLGRAVELEPKGPFPHLHLAMIAAREGRTRAETDHLAIAREGGISDEEILRARREVSAGTAP